MTSQLHLAKRNILLQQVSHPDSQPICNIQKQFQLLLADIYTRHRVQQFPVASEVFCFSVKNAAITAGVS